MSAVPDVEFAAAHQSGQGDAQTRKQDDLDAPIAIQSTVNYYDAATKKLTQTGSVNLARRVDDDGAVQSPLDLEGALVDVMMSLVLSSGKMPDDPGASFKFQQLTLYAGHYTVHLDPEHPAARCGSDIYFFLPSHLPPPR